MANGSAWTRRGVLAAASWSAAALVSRRAGAQVTDLRGFDPLWRDAEDAIRAFFGDVTYDRDGLTLDLPQHAETGGSVPMTVRVAAAMTEAEYPRVVHVLAHGNPTPHVLSAWFTPRSGRAEFSTRIRLERSQRVTAIAEMSDGRHRRVDRELSVSFGACAQIGSGGNDEVAAFRPQTRVSVPPRAQRGEIIPIRALISHPMETGLRLDATEEWVRQRIISRFACTFEGEEVFRVRLHPAVSTNPYFLFYARAQRSGVFGFDWYDTTDETYLASAPIAVD
ncbi:thiosulfate oxidation carrier complex protein SoxZ [Alsobacter sp. SYSU M60028]|uniref:Thiosulfate oxidation carrier complex protein SoxZ n=1 Tax=Alsobacter ponti TaxID=2962936 RepID=A0ABT1LJ39_9HYPH|nr:thiosulfate oxidation carrier protein SoxY [Alsobacter ponti]MCP8940956.1 thiosulfate oxidation carrier complex protein SoxZ [Alsobacter ponti]